MRGDLDSTQERKGNKVQNSTRESDSVVSIIGVSPDSGRENSVKLEDQPLSGIRTCPGADTAIPLSASVRNRMRRDAQRFLEPQKLIPPLSMEELCDRADALIARQPNWSVFRDFLTVIISNALWRDTVARVPFQRRVLLLPQCLSDPDHCQAQSDDLGLLCEQCGRCVIGSVSRQAEELGYHVVIAEGTTMVTSLVASGQVDAVIGVSCLNALERSFPYLIAGAVPGLAIPLLKDGCVRTRLDWAWLVETLRLQSDQAGARRLDLKKMRKLVDFRFSEEQIRPMVNLRNTGTEETAIRWLVAGGKRWRPYLTVCVNRAVSGVNGEMDPVLQSVALAVECFHKASLVHDDIEDDDRERYGRPTLHQEVGMPVALNVGDFLIGEGYRLIAECKASSEQIGRMLTVAARGHRGLSLGQGAELEWNRRPKPLSRQDVLEIFTQKTAPAFEVALVLGAISGGGNGEICDILSEYSAALGIAYQIKDDLNDFLPDTGEGDLDALRPSLLMALAWEKAGKGEGRRLLNALQQRRPRDVRLICGLIITEFDLESEAERLFNKYKSQALAALAPLRHPLLKGLLFQMVHKILGDPASADRTVRSVRPVPRNQDGLWVDSDPQSGEGMVPGYAR